MLIKSKRGWELPESAATPESLFLDRRRLIKGLAAGPLIAALPPALLTAAQAASAPDVDPTADLYPVNRNMRYRVDRPITEEAEATSYNNYYEFNSSKDVVRQAQKLTIRPWEVRIDGLVEKPITIAFDDLVRKMPLEERVYRMRCVEAWSMTVPWSGFPMKALVEFAKPAAGAKYVHMRSFQNPKEAPGQREFWYPWPYVEGLTIEEATHELAFMVTGIYGKPLPKQNGAPLRLATPWKYGFKSIKGIVQFTFSDQRPRTFWERLASREYGFWANVNPDVAHPRWSQANERVLGGEERVPTLLYNGYGEFVAELYKDLKGEKLFM
jgi:sulfoxide reductase catalytic subunit YedY